MFIFVPKLVEKDDNRACVGIIKLPVILELSCVAVESNIMLVSEDVVEKNARAEDAATTFIVDVAVDRANESVVDVMDE